MISLNEAIDLGNSIGKGTARACACAHIRNILPRQQHLPNRPPHHPKQPIPHRNQPPLPNRRQSLFPPQAFPPLPQIHPTESDPDRPGGDEDDAVGVGGGHEGVDEFGEGGEEGEEGGVGVGGGDDG